MKRCSKPDAAIAASVRNVILAMALPDGNHYYRNRVEFQTTDATLVPFGSTVLSRQQHSVTGVSVVIPFRDVVGSR